VLEPQNDGIRQFFRELGPDKITHALLEIGTERGRGSPPTPKLEVVDANAFHKVVSSATWPETPEREPDGRKARPAQKPRQR